MMCVELAMRGYTKLKRVECQRSETANRDVSAHGAIQACCEEGV